MAITLFIDSEAAAALEYLAEVEGVSKQAAAGHTTVHTEAVRAAAGRMKQRWGSVLDRLGE